MKEAHEMAIAILVERWAELVESGEFTQEEMVKSLNEQIDANSQGWDASAEELDEELIEVMGYDEDEITDEQLEDWLAVVQEAARRYLESK